MIIDTELLDYAVEVLFHILDCFRYGPVKKLVVTSQYLCADPEGIVRVSPTLLRWIGSGLCYSSGSSCLQKYSFMGFQNTKG